MKGVENHANHRRSIMIKPSSPTPHHKRSVKLSLLDQQFNSGHIKLVLFYTHAAPATEQRVVLTTSLSETLTKFYPYAGRIKDNTSIECTDEGVVYTEAEVDSSVVSDVLSKRDPGMFEKLLPPDVGELDGLETIPLMIQANFFKDGGLALGVVASHRIMDGVALSNFIRNWAITAAVAGVVAATAAADIDQSAPAAVEVGPDFTMPSSIYPPNDFLNSVPKRPVEQPTTTKNENIHVSKRYVFKDSSIAKLKAKLVGTTTDDPNPKPTRVEAVTALIWKCAIKASRFSCSSKKKSSSMCLQAVNTRKRWVPPLPENTPGNNIGSFFAKKVYKNNICNANDNDDDDELLMSELVRLLKDGLRGFCDTHMKKLQDRAGCSWFFESEEGNIWMMQEEVDVYIFSSWCGFKLYNADFGWGKPEWILPSFNNKNVVILMDTKDGDGIEVWVTLMEQHMDAFQKDQDLLQLANSDP